MPPGGFYLDAKDEPRRHPAAIEALACGKELRVALEALGISAPGRARLLGNVKPRVLADDPAEEFFHKLARDNQRTAAERAASGE